MIHFKFNVSFIDTFKVKVKPGKLYLLRLVNAALNNELFFGIANHTLTVVEADAVYVKPFETRTVIIAPGQTTNVLLRAKPEAPNAAFVMAATPYISADGTFDTTTAAGLLEYKCEKAPGSNDNENEKGNKLPLLKPAFPRSNDTSFSLEYNRKVRSLANGNFPAKVPKTVDRKFFFTVGLGLGSCSEAQNCQGPNNTRVLAAMNNVSFVQPNTAMLQAHFFSKSEGVYRVRYGFPNQPTIRIQLHRQTTNQCHGDTWHKGGGAWL